MTSLTHGTPVRCGGLTVWTYGRVVLFSPIEKMPKDYEAVAVEWWSLQDEGFSWAVWERLDCIEVLPWYYEFFWEGRLVYAKPVEPGVVV